MSQATNVTVEKVFKGASGEGQYGPWQAWDVYFEGSENKYSYFSGGKKPEPFRGQKVAFVKFEVKEVEKDGKTYTNRKISEWVPDDTQEASKPAPGKPSQAQGGTSGFNPMSMYVSYAKDLQKQRVAMMDTGGVPSLHDLCTEVAIEGKRLFDLVEGDGAPEKKEAPPGEGSPFPPDSEAPPF